MTTADQSLGSRMDDASSGAPSGRRQASRGVPPSNIFVEPLRCSAAPICTVGLVLTYPSVTVALGACRESSVRVGGLVGGRPCGPETGRSGRFYCRTDPSEWPRRSAAASGAAGLVHYSRQLRPGLGRARGGWQARVVGGRVLGCPSGAEAGIPGCPCCLIQWK